MGARTITWGRCTPLIIVDQFGVKIRGFTLSCEALGRLLKKKKKMKKKKKKKKKNQTQQQVSLHSSVCTQKAAIALEPLTTHPDEWAEPSHK